MFVFERYQFLFFRQKHLPPSELEPVSLERNNHSPAPLTKGLLGVSRKKGAPIECSFFVVGSECLTRCRDVCRSRTLMSHEFSRFGTS